MSDSLTGERTWIDEAADRFQFEWKRGTDRPRIEDFVAETAGLWYTLLLQELLHVERELRKNTAELPLPPGYRQRFPDDCAAVDAVFGDDAHSEPPLGSLCANPGFQLLMTDLAFPANPFGPWRAWTRTPRRRQGKSKGDLENAPALVVTVGSYKSKDWRIRQ